eukprot:scaffold7277_cov80-Skeletonema_menzelii.AAC.2
MTTSDHGCIMFPLDPTWKTYWTSWNGQRVTQKRQDKYQRMLPKAYTPSGNEEEELNALLERKLIWPFLECTAAGCQRLGRANWGMHSG